MDISKANWEYFYFCISLAYIKIRENETMDHYEQANWLNTEIASYACYSDLSEIAPWAERMSSQIFLSKLCFS